MDSRYLDRFKESTEKIVEAQDLIKDHKEVLKTVGNQIFRELSTLLGPISSKLWPFNHLLGYVNLIPFHMKARCRLVSVETKNGKNPVTFCYSGDDKDFEFQVSLEEYQSFVDTYVQQYKGFEIEVDKQKEAQLKILEIQQKHVQEEIAKLNCSLPKKDIEHREIEVQQ